MNGMLQRLRERKLVQWALAYAAAAFALLQGLDIVAQQFAWPDGVRRGITLALAVGFCVTLLLAWYHGERGAQRVSGIELLLLALLLAVGGGLLWRFSVAPARRDAVPVHGDASAAPPAMVVSAKSIAVLPFVNMSGDAQNDYFSDGITEEILNALAQIGDLKVAARTSAFAFKGKDADLRKVGEMLAVATVLEGSVQRAGDDVRITAQLIDARSGFQLWSQKYDRKLTNLFAIEDEISQSIADKLQLQLAGARVPGVGIPGNEQAHEQYLRGLTLLAARGPGLRDAIAAFREAVRLDPQYAQAWGALAEAEILLPGYVPGVKDAMQRAESAAQRALAIDPGTASAHVALAGAYVNRREWPQAQQALERALELAPGDVEVINQYAQFLGTTGQLEPALLQIDHARRLDPLSAIVGLIRATILMGLHRDADATAQLEATLAAHPDFVIAHWTATIHYAELERFAEAESHARAGAKVAGLDPEAIALPVRGMAVPADRAAAVQGYESAVATNPDDDQPLFDAIILALLGERDKSLARIEVFVNRPGTIFGGLLWVPALDPLRDEPRFQAALKAMNLPYRPAVAAP